MEEEERRAPLAVNQSDQDIDQAVRRIYEVYGSNLAAFFSMAHGQLKADGEDPEHERIASRKHA